MEKKIIIGLFLLGLFFAASAQSSILTASAFFKSVSEKYGSMQDYEADMSIKANRNSMQAKVSFKQPNLLRIDFTDPDSQVIVFNGELLTIYLPGPRAVLNQSVEGGNSAAGGTNLATPQGLSLMSRYYSIAYETGQTPIPLNEGKEEMVVRLLLSRKNTSEGFRTIKLAVNPESLLIRRVEAISTTGQTFVFDFSNYALNQNIPNTRFIYDSPSSANAYNNFLFME